MARAEELKGPTLNTSDLVRGIEADLARQENAVAVAAMLAERGLPETLMTLPPRKETSWNLQREGGCAISTSISASIKDMSESGLLEDQSPRPWVCHRLNVLRITLHRTSMEWNGERKKTDSQVFQQLSQLRCLRELFLCSFQNALRVHGLNPRLALGMDLRHPEFRGQFINATKIRKHRMGSDCWRFGPG